MAKRLSATLEDYLGVVLRFQREKRFARVSDISSTLGVAKSAVTAALQSLSNKGLLNYRPYEPVTLTAAGEKQADEILLRHRVIRDFLQDVLALDAEEAELTACEMEHAVSSSVLERFVCFLAFVSTRPKKGRTWLKEFRDFTRSGAENQTCQKCIEEYIRKTRQEAEPKRG